MILGDYLLGSNPMKTLLCRQPKKGFELPPGKMNTPHHSRSASAVLEWTISGNGHIRGHNTDKVMFGVTVEWTPAVEGGRVAWNCRVTIPERFSNLAPPPCPELL